jgi:hypothetical protein
MGFVALSRAIEPNADVQARLRLPRQHRLTMAKARQRAERSLLGRRDHVDRLGLPLPRGSRREELLKEIAHWNTAVRMADKRLTKLAGQVRDLRNSPSGRRRRTPATGLQPHR